MALDAARLWGTWHLRRFEITYADGRTPIQPFGEGATGLLMYGRDGTMSAILARAERPPLTAPGLETAGRAPTEQKAGAFDSYLSYGGTWHLEGDEVVHRVQFALVPNLVGQDNRRHATLDGDVLRLSYRLMARSGVERTYTLHWARGHQPTVALPSGPGGSP